MGCGSGGKRGVMEGTEQEEEPSYSTGPATELRVLKEHGRRSQLPLLRVPLTRPFVTYGLKSHMDRNLSLQMGKPRLRIVKPPAQGDRAVS